ncbi:G-D-S-L family lipolytic protein [Oceanihabitans sp.]|nr:G-D-S-L family lipolytic protein [Oceanihabitans sp.]
MKTTIMNTKYILLAAILIGFTACNSDDDSSNASEALPPLTAGTANLSKYVSIGNSLTAGFTDNALFIATQENSFPNTLAQKFALVGGGTFTQPLMNDNYGGLYAGGQPIINPMTGETLFKPRLVTTGGAPVPLESVIGPVTVSTDIVLNNPTGPFNNMGVPGAASFHLLAPGYGNLANFSAGLANPYFIRMTGTTPDATIMELSLAQSPSFVSLWIGANDVLGYATGGASSAGPTPQPVFDGAMGAIMNSLDGIQGIMANVPYVTTIPFFTTVQHNELDPSNPAFGSQIPTLNATFAALNGAFAFLGMPERSITFSETENSPMVIYDESLENIQASLFSVLVGGGLDVPTAGVLSAQFAQSRQATEDDLFTLTSASVIATLNEDYFTALVTAGVPAETAGQLSVNGVTFPMEDQWVLIPSEQDEIKTAIDGFNATLQSSANAAGFAFVDANAIFSEMANGGYADGDFILTADLVSGGAVSLDGVHPTSRGYALVANEMMKAIDATYGSNFEASGNLIDIGDYPTNYSPLLP